ncbi:MAG: hypothetical protein JSW25_08670, partial [Thermoplasmata archaeon]
VTFDLRWRFNGTPLTIAVQTDADSGLVELARIDPDGPCEDWLHVEVPLGDYIDSMPRIVIYPSIYPEDTYFIRDLNVTDGGSLLPYDIPPDTDHYYGGWLVDGFIMYSNAMSWNWRDVKVMDLQGAVRIEGSTVRVATEVTRTGYGTVDRENIFSRWPDKNIWASVRGMHIELDHGRLDARGSVFEHAPIMANSSILDMTGCRFESAYDMVTMSNCYGSIVDNTFVGKDLPEGMGHWIPSYLRPMWAISLENNTGGGVVEVIDCEFNDVGQAIDLARAVYDIEDCTFRRVTDICIWDHASRGATEWEDLSSANSFQYCTGDLYMRTGTTDLEFNGTSVQYQNETFFDTEGTPIDKPDYTETRWSYWSGKQARLVRMDLLVEAMDTVRVVNRTDMYVWSENPYDGPYTTLLVTIDAGVESMYVDLFTLFEEQVGHPWEDVRSWADLRKVWPAGDAPVGTYNLSIVLYTRELYIYNISVDLLLDNQLVRHIGEEEFWMELATDSRAQIEQTMFFEPGTHDLQVVISGFRVLNGTNVSDEREVFLDHSFHIMRAAPENTSEEIVEFLKEPGVVLAVEAGTTFVLDDLQPTNSSLYYDLPSFNLTGGEGSGLTFRGFDNESALFMHIVLFSHVNLSFVDTQVPAMYLAMGSYYLTYQEQGEVDPEAIMGEITFSNCTTRWMWLDIWQYSLSVSECTVAGEMAYFCAGNGSVSISNVTGVYTSCYASGPIWSYTVTDSHFTGYNASGFYIHADEIRTLRFSNCTFVDASLHIDVEGPYKGPWELDVTGCEFTGNGSFLSMLWSTYHRSNWGESPASYPIPFGSVSGNTFSGTDTVVVLHHALYRTTLGDNTFADGAKAWAWYWTKINPHPEISTSNEYTLIVLDDPDLPTEFPVRNNLHLRDENYFYEVTGDLGGDIEPPPLRVVVQWRTERGYRLMTTDFVDVDLQRDVNTFTYTIWPDLQGVLALHIEDWPWEKLERWEGGRW